MAITPVNSSLTVTTSGTRQQVTTDTTIKPSSVYIEALGTNTGYIYLGTSTVSSTVYITRIPAGQGFTISPDVIAAAGTDIRLLQLSSIYIDCSVSGEKVQMTYFAPVMI